MGLFNYPGKGKQGTFEVDFPDRDGICGHLWRCPKREDEPSLLDKDAEVEGQKRGITKASRVYEPILRNLKEKYEVLMAVAKKDKDQLGNKIQEQINLLKKKEDFERTLNEKIDSAGEKIGIPAGTIGSALARGESYCDIYPRLPGLLDIFYDYKMKKISEYEAKYYKKTVAEVWEPKMKELEERFRNLRAEVDGETKDYVALFEEAVFEISEQERKISQLEILLETMKK